MFLHGDDLLRQVLFWRGPCRTSARSRAMSIAPWMVRDHAEHEGGVGIGVRSSPAIIGPCMRWPSRCAIGRHPPSPRWHRAGAGSPACGMLRRWAHGSSARRPAFIGHCPSDAVDRDVQAPVAADTKMQRAPPASPAGTPAKAALQARQEMHLARMIRRDGETMIAMMSAWPMRSTRPNG